MTDMPIEPPRRQPTRSRRLRATIRYALLTAAGVLLVVSLLMGWR
ncbi:hypothetical protein [Mycolicibacterium iranicum]|uniref:Uncharacterized protein n=1 Tax=Mycolicibacterium iranicum TaxID=912594 RepID=A0ABT4HQL7_MYCIR|nr:hypothetical protein [Mycolicibacterium iranicum]MCZ0732505.1 hypothetical protein [Mycolicibacterium iranicum]